MAWSVLQGAALTQTILPWVFRSCVLEYVFLWVHSAPRFWVRCLEILLMYKGCDLQYYIYMKPNMDIFHSRMSEYHEF